MPADTRVRGVDGHAHVFARGLPLAAVRRHAPDFDALLSEYLALLDAHGLSHGVLVQPSFLGTDNHYLLEALRSCPHRLRGVVMLEPTVSDAELQAMDALGVCGMRLNLVGLPVPPLHAPDWQGLLARLRALDWHVEVHRGSEDLCTVVRPLLDAGCKVVVDHFGRPATLPAADDAGFQALLALAGTGRVWVKLAAAYRSWPRQDAPDVATAAALLRQHFGSTRLVWGSDWPHTQHQHLSDFAASLAVLAQWLPDAADREAACVHTPAALFRCG